MRVVFKYFTPLSISPSSLYTSAQDDIIAIWNLCTTCYRVFQFCSSISVQVHILFKIFSCCILTIWYGFELLSSHFNKKKLVWINLFSILYHISGYCFWMWNSRSHKLLKCLNKLHFSYPTHVQLVTN